MADIMYDAIVVGTGLAGGWAAKELSEAGLASLALDAGPSVSPYAVRNNGRTKPRNQEAAKRQPIQSKHPAYWLSNSAFFVDDIDNPYRSDTEFHWIRGRQVGGRSLTWGGVALRFSDYEFSAPEQDGCGARWPIGYSDVAGYYDKVESFARVQGSIEGLPQLPDGTFQAPADLTETEIEFKSVVESRWGSRKVIICRGIPRNHARSKLSSPEWSPRTSSGTTLPAALSTGNTTVRPDSVVSHLITDRDSPRIKGVACIDRITREAFEVRGRVVVLAASTIESVRILMNSTGPQHPGGVGNSCGLLGRGLCDHLAVTLGGIIPNSKHLPHYEWGGPCSICIPKFRNVGEPTSDFIRGYGIWGGMQRKEVARNQNARWSLTSILEVLPSDDNRVGMPGRS